MRPPEFVAAPDRVARPVSCFAASGVQHVLLVSLSGECEARNVVARNVATFEDMSPFPKVRVLIKVGRSDCRFPRRLLGGRIFDAL